MSDWLLQIIVLAGLVTGLAILAAWWMRRR
jgi:hypothetical protein